MSDDQVFDPTQFMAQNVDAAFATDFQICPETEAQAMIDDFDEKAFNLVKWNDKDSGEPRSATQFSCPFVIQSEEVKATMHRDKVVVPAKMFLDTDANGQLSSAPDRNVMLGRIRAAVNQNTPGWNFSHLKGAGPVMVKVTHRSYKDKSSGEMRKTAEVTRVAPIR